MPLRSHHPPRPRGGCWRCQLGRPLAPAMSLDAPQNTPTRPPWRPSSCMPNLRLLSSTHRPQRIARQTPPSLPSPLRPVLLPVSARPARDFVGFPSTPLYALDLPIHALFSTNTPSVSRNHSCSCIVIHYHYAFHTSSHVYSRCCNRIKRNCTISMCVTEG